jgi:hypothetical protein
VGGHMWGDRRRRWYPVPILIVIALTVAACSSGGLAAVTNSRQFFINVGSNNASYITWTKASGGLIKGSEVAAARSPEGTTQIPTPTRFTGKVEGHDITFDFGPSVQGGEATLSGQLGPNTLTITYPPSNGSCKTNPVVVYKAGSLMDFKRIVKHLSTTPTCLPS